MLGVGGGLCRAGTLVGTTRSELTHSINGVLEPRTHDINQGAQSWLNNLPHVLPHSFSHHRLGPLGSGGFGPLALMGFSTEQCYVSTHLLPLTPLSLEVTWALCVPIWGLATAWAALGHRYHLEVTEERGLCAFTPVRIPDPMLPPNLQAKKPQTLSGPSPWASHSPSSSAFWPISVSQHPSPSSCPTPRFSLTTPYLRHFCTVGGFPPDMS